MKQKEKPEPKEKPKTEQFIAKSQRPTDFQSITLLCQPTDWERFTSKSFNSYQYELKYPRTWLARPYNPVIGESPYNEAWGMEFYPELKEGEEMDFWFTISFTEEIWDKGLDQYYGIEAEPREEVKDVIVNGLEALKIKYSQVAYYSRTLAHVFVKLPTGNLAILTLHSQDTISPEAMPMFDQFISCFHPKRV